MKEKTPWEFGDLRYRNGPQMHPGQIFSELTVIREAGKNNSGRYVLCECTCGKSTEVKVSFLVSGNTKSCGHLRKVSHTIKHARSGKGDPTYNTWRAVVSRCTKKYDWSWDRYGAVGITVCDRWLDFSNFLDDMGDRPKGMTIDRIDNSKGYFPGNCRWATNVEQANNTTLNKIVEYRGHKGPLKETVSIFGGNYSLVKERIKRGWSMEDAMNKPVKEQYHHGRKKLSDEMAKQAIRERMAGESLSDIAEKYDVSRRAIEYICNGTNRSHLLRDVEEEAIREKGMMG